METVISNNDAELIIAALNFFYTNESFATDEVGKAEQQRVNQLIEIVTNNDTIKIKD